MVVWGKTVSKTSWAVDRNRILQAFQHWVVADQSIHGPLIWKSVCLTKSKKFLVQAQEDLFLVEGVDYLANFDPYHLQRVQGLNNAYFALRIAFCNWFLQKFANNSRFPSIILFTDEADFTRNGIINFYNFHFCRTKKSLCCYSSRYQQQFIINVWGE